MEAVSQSYTSEVVDPLFDPGSFQEMFVHDQDKSVLAGLGRVNGRETYLLADSPVEVPLNAFWRMEKKVKFLEAIKASPHPLILVLGPWVKPKQPAPDKKFRMYVAPGTCDALLSSGGFGRCTSLYPEVAAMVPTVCILKSDLQAGFVFPTGLCSLTILVKGTHICFAGAHDIKRITGKSVNPEEMSGAEMHCTVSGTGDVLAENFPQAIEHAKKYLSFVPSDYRSCPPETKFDLSLAPNLDFFNLEPQPLETKRPFDVRDFIKAVVDKDPYFETKEIYAKECVTCFAKLQGRTVGIVANNSNARYGAIYPETCRKIAKFVSVCDTFNIPLVFLADTPGFMVDTELERSGAIKYATLLLSTLSAASVLKIHVNIRKSFGGGIYSMSGPGFADKIACFPKVLFGPFGQLTAEAKTEEERKGMEELFTLENPQKLKELGHVDEVLQPKDLRQYLVKTIETHKPRLKTLVKNLVFV